MLTIKEASKIIKENEKLNANVKLNKIFECEGKLYAIAKTDTASVDYNLNYGRSMFEFILL